MSYLCKLMPIFRQKPNIFIIRKSIITTALALALGSTALFAIQAKKGVERIFTQADGTTLTVTVTGDERSHCYLTTDGIPLMEDGNGNLYYATLDAAGKAVRSDMLARDPMMRSAADNARLRTIDKDILRHDLLAKRASA